MRILLVDDDALLTQTLASYLITQHYVVDVAMDGEAGWSYAQAANYDLILLDIDLPKLDGVRLCQTLRQAKYTMPILLLTAQGDSADKVLGLDAGADDYLVKPCTTEELSARIRALLRRQHTAMPVLQWGELLLDPCTCEVVYQKQVLPLSPKEYGLLELFLRNPQRVFSSSSILEHLWGFDAPGEETIRTHIKRLRRKLKAAGVDEIIDTIYGMGYRLKALTEPEPATIDTAKADQARAAAIALWEQFKPPILERLLGLEQTVAAMKAGSLSETMRQTAARDAHKLAGSLGMFGFPKGSCLGQEIEEWFRTMKGTKSVDQLDALVTALQQELQQTPQASDSNLLTALCEDSLNSELLTSQSQDIPLRENRSVRSPNACASNIKVLVVDDEPLILKTLQEFLPRWGIHPVMLSHPLDFWRILTREKPDLLILDVDMPHTNGIELCQMIRQRSEWDKLPILFLTAHRDPDIVLQLYRVGADDYVAKPFTESEIITRIFNRLERNRLLQTTHEPRL
ncbi:MAG: response regulator [Leptolyngbya sp. BL-A-14]